MLRFSRDPQARLRVGTAKALIDKLNAISNLEHMAFFYSGFTAGKVIGACPDDFEAVAVGRAIEEMRDRVNEAMRMNGNSERLE